MNKRWRPRNPPVGGNPSAATGDSWNHKTEERNAKEMRTRRQHGDEIDDYMEGNEREAYLWGRWFNQ